MLHENPSSADGLEKYNNKISGSTRRKHDLLTISVEQWIFNQLSKSCANIKSTFQRHTRTNVANKAQNVPGGKKNQLKRKIAEVFVWVAIEISNSRRCVLKMYSNDSSKKEIRAKATKKRSKKGTWGSRERTSMSFLIVIAFFAVFGIIILTEVNHYIGLILNDVRIFKPSLNLFIHVPFYWYYITFEKFLICVADYRAENFFSSFRRHQKVLYSRNFRVTYHSWTFDIDFHFLFISPTQSSLAKSSIDPFSHNVHCFVPFRLTTTFFMLLVDTWHKREQFHLAGFDDRRSEQRVGSTNEPK